MSPAHPAAIRSRQHRLARHWWLLVAVTCLASLAWRTPVRAAAPVQYRFTFPEPQHHWMQVDATFADLGAAPLELRMSRSSPGRYSLHDFAKNVYDIHAVGADGRELALARPDPHGWTATGHGGGVTVRYKVYGDRVDGTYLAVDETHAHINMPAAIMWARGLDDRPATLRVEPPAGADWRVATQLHPGATDWEFMAPNLQYLMDSPAEVGPVAIAPFSIGAKVFRFAAHHTGTAAELEAFVKDVEKVVRQEGAIFGEYPDYEPGRYTFLADYLPYAQSDAMEHRNSAVLTSESTVGTNRVGLLESVAHEFFHSWNVERIRPRGLEPFDLERANMSSELWLAEGFTQYYGVLALGRAQIVDAAWLASAWSYVVDLFRAPPSRLERSAEEVSQMAPFVDGSSPVDRTNWSTSVASYYTVGTGLALALDLTLRDRSDGRVTLDDAMRALWHRHGKPGGARQGYVDRPYTPADVEEVLAEVSHDRAFAADFYARHVRGREVPDFARLLRRAGFLVRKRAAGRSWLGDLGFVSGQLQVATLVAPTWPVYAAGLEQDDVIERIDGRRLETEEDFVRALARHKPGERIELAFRTRAGRSRTIRLTLGEDPHLEVVPLEAIGVVPTPAEKAFRDRWLQPRS